MARWAQIHLSKQLARPGGEPSGTEIYRTGLFEHYIHCVFMRV